MTLGRALSGPGAGQALDGEVAARDLTLTSLVNNVGFPAGGPCREEERDRVPRPVPRRATDNKLAAGTDRRRGCRPVIGLVHPLRH